MKRASYKDAIAWIAENDESAEMGLEHIRDMPTSCLVADLFGISGEEVAAEVLLVRTKRKAADLRAARATDKEAAQ